VLPQLPKNLDAVKVNIFREKLFEWYENNFRTFPWRDHKASPYQILVAEIMLQKTRAENIVDIYRQFIETYPNPMKLSQTSIPALIDLLKPLGLYKIRSKRLHEMGKVLVKMGEIPNNSESLKKILGIGPYILNSFLLVAFNRRLPVVDTNIRRLYEKVFSIKSKKVPRRDKFIWKFAKRILPEKNYKEFTWALLDFSALVCAKKHPKCQICPLTKICDFYNLFLKKNSN
jgi:A/G-specific adenine glycosylase